MTMDETKSVEQAFEWAQLNRKPNLFEKFTDEQLEAIQCLVQARDEDGMPCRETDPEFWVHIDFVKTQVNEEFFDRFPLIENPEVIDNV
jgi:hypothetical protein